MAQFRNDEAFKLFVGNLDKNIQNYKEPKDKEAFFQSQKAQVERLVKLEKDFRKALQDHKWGLAAYRDFIDYIINVKRNILSARPFFRERQEEFTANISGAIKERDAKALFKFNVNYQFIALTMKSRNWGKNSQVFKLANEIKGLRIKICELNMPLAISRARLFWSKTPESHLSYMDLVQIAAEGLLAAIDKFVLPFGKVFRAVVIGRVTGNHIESYSDTMLHFYPNDKRKIYRANKAVRHLGGVASADFEVLAGKVNEGMDDAINQTNAIELADLMGAASTVSSDSSATSLLESDSIQVLTNKFAADSSTRPDFISENKDLVIKVGSAIETLTIFEKKLLRLKGIAL